MSGGLRKRIQSPYFATGNPESEETTTLYAPGMLGCVADFDQGGISGPPNVCTYQLVLQDSAITAALGGVYVWKTKSSYVVTTVLTNSGQAAGVARKVGTTAASYIWIAKRGDLGVLLINSPTSAADATGKPVTTGGSASAPAADCVALSTTVAEGQYIGGTLSTQDGTSHIATVRINVTDVF